MVLDVVYAIDLDVLVNYLLDLLDLLAHLDILDLLDLLAHEIGDLVLNESSLLT